VGFVEEIKGVFTEKLISGMGYSIVSGLASGTLGALLGRYANNKWASWLGYIFGGAGMAYVAEKFLKHPEWKGYAVFGALFPPVWELVTDKINPEDLANKVAMGLGLSWQQAATQYYAPAQPVQLTVTPAPAPAPAPTPTAEEYMF